jgi:hypothetical protein
MGCEKPKSSVTRYTPRRRASGTRRRVSAQVPEQISTQVLEQVSVQAPVCDIEIEFATPVIVAGETHETEETAPTFGPLQDIPYKAFIDTLCFEIIVMRNERNAEHLRMNETLETIAFLHSYEISTGDAFIKLKKQRKKAFLCLKNPTMN